MFNHKRKLIVAVLLATGVTSALAEESTAEQLNRLSTSRAIWAAKKADEEMRAAYYAKKAEADRYSPENTASFGGPNGQESPPVVAAIEGADGRLTATLVFAGGAKQTAKQGEKIRGGWTIDQISISSVVLAKGRERLVLTFGDEPPKSAAASTGVAPGPAGPGPVPGAGGYFPPAPSR